MSDGGDKSASPGPGKTSPGPVTPVYLKTDTELDWPEDDRVFYVLSASGLFVCRNGPFFRSCVTARRWPSELALHQEHLDLSGHPKIPQDRFERIVGFFSEVGERHGAEAAALILWDARAREVAFRIPFQNAGVTRGRYGARYSCDVRYTIPTLPDHLTLIGDIHSHVDQPAYSSGMDKLDEMYRPGLHIVVGRIFNERPEFHCEFVVDGIRFPVDLLQVIEGFDRRRFNFPGKWLQRIEIETTPARSWKQPAPYPGTGTGTGTGKSEN